VIDSPRDDGGGRIAAILLILLVAVPLLPNPGAFTNADSPKWMLLAAGTLLAVAFVFVRAVRSKEEVTVLLPEHLVLTLLAVCAALFVGKRAPDARATIRALAGIGTMCSFGLIATGYLAGGRDVRRFALAALGVMAATTAIGLAQVLFGATAGPTATFGNRSFAAEYVAEALPLTFFFILTGRRALGFAGLAVGALFLAVAWSRADVLGAAAGILLATILAWPPRFLRRRSPWLLAVIVIALAVALPYAIRAVRLPTLGRSDTVEIRDRIRASTVEMAADHATTGVGLEGFRAHYPKYRDPEEARLSLRREVTFPHNLPLAVFAEAGIVGLALLLLFLIVPLYSGIRTAFERRDDAFAPAATGALAAILVSAQFSAPLRHPGSALLFFSISALLVARRPRRVVTPLTGRYRRAAPVVVMAVPVIAALASLGPHLLADFHLRAAKDVTEAGTIDDAAADRLRASIRAEPGPDALRRLAYHENMAKKPEAALATVESLIVISPWDELGRIERARALRKLDRLDEARALLDELVEARPGDDVSLMLRGLVRGQQGDREGALPDILDAVKSAPLDAAERHAALVHRSIADFEPALIRTAERLGKTDLARAVAILKGIGTGEADFYRALAYLTHDRPDAAMVALQSSVGTGFVTRNRLLSDPRLEPLRARSDFRALLGGR